MPYQTEWAPAEVFLEHKGVTIYHVYKDNEMELGARTYHYALVEDSDDNSVELAHGFDVRELSTWQEPGHPPYCCGVNNTPENQAAWKRWHEEEVEVKAIRAALIAAIESGELKNPEEEEL